MVAVAIAKDNTPAELRALARRERDGRVSASQLMRWPTPWTG